MVNFMCQLDCIKEYIHGKELFLGVPFRGFLKETDVWFSRLSGEDLPSIWVGTMQSARTPDRITTKAFFFCLWKSGLGF